MLYKIPPSPYTPTNSARKAYHRQYYRKHRDRLLRLAHLNHTSNTRRRTGSHRRVLRRFSLVEYVRTKREECGVVLYFD